MITEVHQNTRGCKKTGREGENMCKKIDINENEHICGKRRTWTKGEPVLRKTIKKGEPE